MTLKDAIESGRPFRVVGCDLWMYVHSEAGRFTFDPTSDLEPIRLCVRDVLRDDYETRGETLELSWEDVTRAIRISTGLRNLNLTDLRWALGFKEDV